MIARRVRSAPAWLGALLALASCESRPPAQASAPATPPAVDRVSAGGAVVDLGPELDKVRADRKLPALAAVAWRDGRLMAAGVVGVRAAGEPTRATLDDRWHLASNGKAMTATLIGIHVDRGVLGWNDTIGKLFAGEPVDPGYREVTLDQLLRHTGGAPGNPPADLWQALWLAGDDPHAAAEFVHGLLARKPAQRAGMFVYSNAGYMIAGVALERATGQRFRDLMRDELFAPLDMTSCGFGSPGSAAAVDQPRGHDASGAPVSPGPAADNPPGAAAFGTEHCSLADYGKFLAVHAGAPDAPRLVSPATLSHLHTPAEGESYAGGWNVVIAAGSKLLQHSGSNTMWYATAFVGLGKRSAFVLVANQADPSLEEAVPALLQRVRDGPP